jgi:hypothetical protein
VFEAVEALRSVAIGGSSGIGRRREDLIAVVVSGLNHCAG